MSTLTHLDASVDHGSRPHFWPRAPLALSIPDLHSTASTILPSTHHLGHGRDRWELLHWCFRGRAMKAGLRFFLPSKMIFCAGEIQVFCHMPNLKLPLRCKSSPSKDFGLLIWAWSWSTSWLAPNLLYLLPFFPLNLLMILMVVLCCSILLSIPRFQVQRLETGFTWIHTVPWSNHVKSTSSNGGDFTLRRPEFVTHGSSCCIFTSVVRRVCWMLTSKKSYHIHDCILYPMSWKSWNMVHQQYWYPLVN